MADQYTKIRHKMCGPGGMWCDCCNLWKGKDKRYLNKYARVRLKELDYKDQLTKGDQKMDEVIYYLPRGAQHKKIAVVILKDGDEYSRGLAVCSKKDQFNRKRGLEIARGRAVKALVSSKNGVKNDISRKFETIGLPSEVKNLSTFNPELTEFEQRLFSNRKE